MMRANLWFTVAVSGLLWLAAGLWQIAPRNYPEPGYWFLNPLSWQLLFVVGAAATLHVRRGGKIPVTPWLVRGAAIYAGISFLWIHSPLWGQVTWFGLPPVLGGFDKTFLSLSRLTHILSIAYLIVAVPVASRIVERGPCHPLAIMGKRPLPIFIAGTLMSMVAQVVKVLHPGGVALDGSLIMAGIALQFMLAYCLEWLDGAKGAIQKVPLAPALPLRLRSTGAASR